MKYIVERMAPDELMHFGVKGQQWGVRRGPPYPIEKGSGVKIRKGTKFSRLSLYDEKDAKGHAYVTYEHEDVDRYKGFFGAQLKAKAFVQKNSKVLVHDMEAKEDLISPSQKERINTFLEIYKDNPAYVGKRLGEYHKTGEWHANAYGPKFYYKMKYAKLKDSDLIEKGYKTFVKAIGGDAELRSAYFDKLRAKGYNFIRDDQDSGVQGVSPSIIIDREKSLKYNGNRELTTKEIYDNYRKYGKYLDKERRHKEWES